MMWQTELSLFVLNLVCGYLMDYKISAHRTAKGHGYLIGVSLLASVISHWFPLTVLAFFTAGTFLQVWYVFGKQGSYRRQMRLQGKLQGLYEFQGKKDIDFEFLEFYTRPSPNTAE
jgi:hypothetical protein